MIMCPKTYSGLSMMEIVSESIWVLSRNKKLMASITILSILLSYLLFLLNTTVTPLIQEFFHSKWRSSPTPTRTNKHPFNYITNHLPADADLFGLLIAVELVFVLAYCIASVLCLSAIISVSAMSYSNTSVSINDVFSNVAKSWKRLFITCFCTTVIGLGYVLLFVIALLLVYLVSDNVLKTTTSLTLIGSVATIFIVYESVIWSLALVITAMSESEEGENSCYYYGRKALRRARELFEGNRLNGFAVNSVLHVLGLVVFQVSEMAKHNQLSSPMIVQLFRMSCLRLIVILLFVTNTVLYFRCKRKRRHGEQDTAEFQEEEQEDFKYIKLPAEPITFSQDIP